MFRGRPMFYCSITNLLFNHWVLTGVVKPIITYPCFFAFSCVLRGLFSREGQAHFEGCARGSVAGHAQGHAYAEGRNHHIGICPGNFACFFEKLRIMNTLFSWPVTAFSIYIVSVSSRNSRWCFSRSINIEYLLFFVLSANCFSFFMKKMACLRISSRKNQAQNIL